MSFYFPIPKGKQNNQQIYNCTKCKLDQTKTIPYYVGKKYNGLLILGQTYTKSDLNQQIAMTGERCHIFRSTFVKHGLNLVQHGAIVGAVQCYSLKYSETQYRCCREKMITIIKKLKPKVIICCGEFAFKYLMNLNNKIAIGKLRNRIIPNYEFNCLVFPVFNPNEVKTGNYQYTLKHDLNRILNLWKKLYYKRTIINQELIKRKILNNITIREIKTIDEIKDVFNKVQHMQKVGFDYETTNVKPYDKHFDITHIQLGNAKIAWVFHESLWIDKPLVWKLISDNMKRFLTNPDILKVIQNSKFEDLVSRFKFGIDKIENVFCTMLATHTIDERRGCTSLDFQNLTRFGIPPYSDTIKSFLMKKNKDDKTNTIRMAPHDDMILYGGLDVITTYANYEVLNNVLLDSYPMARKNYNMLLNGHKLFANISREGIPINMDNFYEFKNKIDEKLEIIKFKILQIPEVIAYHHYLTDKTKKGKNKTMEDALQAISVQKKPNKFPKRLQLKRTTSFE